MALPNLHARIGIARIGASLIGDYYQNPVIVVGGVDLIAAEAVQRDSLEITLEKNDVPSSARFTVTSFSGVVPTVGDPVTIGIGSAVDPIFGGQVTSARYVFERDRQVTPWVEVTCGDWTQMFNRRLVTDDFSGMAADDIAIAIVTGYTSGFSTYAITRGLDVIDEFVCINERPLDALKRLAELVGGGVRLDGGSRVHFWDVNGEDTDHTPTPPETLVSGLWSLTEFSHEYDFSQVRTRVIAEGRSTRALMACPVGARSIPIEYGWMFKPTLGKARIGSQNVSYVSCSAVTGILGPPAAEVAIAANPGDFSMTVVSNADIMSSYPVGSSIWFYDGSGNYFLGNVLLAPPDTIYINVGSGHGAIQQPIPAGTAIYGVDGLETITQDSTGALGLSEAIEQGETITVRVVVNDAGAQSAIAALEGGDGIHEDVVSDGDLSYLGVQYLADAQVTAFGAPIAQAQWTTEDLNALPGSPQAISITLTGGIVDTVTIDRVTLTFPVKANDPFPLPLRRCEGSTVKLQGLLDLIQSRVI